MTALRSTLPPELMPPGYGPVTNESAAAPRKLRHEENINRQVQLCVFLRSVGEPWSEAVLALRDLCIGLEDEAFTKAWAEWPCHAKIVDGETVWQPTNTDSATAFQLILGLLSRWGMTFQKRVVSKTPSLPPTTLSPAFQEVIENMEGVAPEAD